MVNSPGRILDIAGIFKETVGGTGIRRENIVGRENVRLGIKRMDLSPFANKGGDPHRVSVGESRSGSRRLEIEKAPRAFSWLAGKELGYSGTDVARYLGVTTSCVTRAISEGNGFDKGNGISV
jgi:hypothetical protein